METPSYLDITEALKMERERSELWSSGSNKPKFSLPAKAVDCHFHVFSKAFPVAPYATLRPPSAGLQAYRALQNRLGFSKGVLVQPSAYGTNNQAYLGLMDELGTADYRMIAVIDPAVTDAGLAEMHARGVRGIRFNLAQAGASSIDTLEMLSERVDQFGWHCQLHLPADVLFEARDLLNRLKSVLVFDHVARIEQPLGIRSPTYKVIRGLLDKGRSWVKLSAPYIDSQSGMPNYSDVGEVASSLVRAAPERMVWGSDWPHATEPVEDKPNDADILDLLSDWVPNGGGLKRILVENPAQLYGFSD